MTDAARARDQARRDAIQHEIARRLRLCRQRQGLPMREVAARVGLSVQQIGKYETGLNGLSVGTLHAICAALGLTVPQLLEGIEPDSAAEGPWSAALLRVGDRDSVERLALMDMFDRMPDPTLRRLVLRMVLRLAETSEAPAPPAAPARPALELAGT